MKIKRNSWNSSPTSKKGVAPRRSYLIQYRQSWQLYFVPRKWIARLKAGPAQKTLGLKVPSVRLFYLHCPKALKGYCDANFMTSPHWQSPLFDPKLLGSRESAKAGSSIHTNVCAYLLMFLKLGARYAPKMCPEWYLCGKHLKKTPLSSIATLRCVVPYYDAVEYFGCQQMLLRWQFIYFCFAKSFEWLK